MQLHLNRSLAYEGLAHSLRNAQPSAPLRPVPASQQRVIPLASTSGRPLEPSSSSSPAPSISKLILPNSARATTTPRSAATETLTTTSTSTARPSATHDVHGAQSKFVFTAPTEAPIIMVGGQRVHSMPPRGLEVFQSLHDWAQNDLVRYLKPVEHCWQPTDFLPDSSSPDFYDQVRELRKSASALPDDYMVVLVGDAITEEALPSYMNMLNTLDGVRDETGASQTPWATWNRHWTAEENRHGDLLNKYLYLTGRVDMHAVERTIQNLIGSGLDPQLENNPYLCFVYTSFQERATKISHGNTARLASMHGDSHLAKLCGMIAADEGRHEAAYTAIVAKLFERDPDGAMLAFADMMRKGIVMPAHYVEDGWHSTNGGNGKTSNLFADYAAVADTIGVYTTNDYASIVDHLVARWDVEHVKVTSGAAAEAQEFLMKHSARVRRLADIQTERRLRDRKRGKSKTANFSWVFKKEVSLI